ncbi:hypothetical protein [uncultured Olleya sp.]|uniref:hypothetical protein n=1 Tax=uncultured Olleya sp. TaxID=757243 RepID=UPI0025986997|nr:hypothetical protein [uncultured Olleya sp.]
MIRTTKKFVTVILNAIILISCTVEEITKNDSDITKSKVSNIEKNENNTQSNKTIGATYKYLKVNYGMFSIKNLIRNSYENATTTGHTIIEVDNNNDIWVFNEIDQTNVDAIFPQYTSNPLCQSCYSVQATYTTILEIEFGSFVTEATKANIRMDFENDLGNLDTELIYYENIDINTEIWIFKDCCKLDPVDDRISTLFNLEIIDVKLHQN